MLGKKKKLTYEAQLREMGIKLAHMEAKAQFNPQTYNPNFEEYREAFEDMDAQQNCARYVWYGLPPNLDGWLIEQMLYFRGALAGFIKGGNLYVLPYAMDGGVNIYGLPTKVQPISYNGEAADSTYTENFGLPLPISFHGRHNKKGGAVLLYDRIPRFGQTTLPLSRFYVNQQLIALQADIMTRIENNLEAACLKLAFECENEKQARQLDQDIAKNLSAGKSYVIMRRDAMSSRDGTPYQTGVTLEVQELVQAWQSVNSIRCGLSGVRNGGAFEKKERSINAEMQGDALQSDLIYDVGLAMRRLWLERMRIQYPEYGALLDPISVEPNVAVERLIRAETAGSMPAQPTEESTEGLN